jgi:hypothetical protein
MGVKQGWPPTYCTRSGTVDRSGKVYCRQHDPGDPEENRRRRMEKWTREEARLETEGRHLCLLRDSGVESLTDQDLERIVAAGGIKAFLPWRSGETSDRMNG